MKERLDILLVARGLVKSREMGRALIMEGKVLVNGERITKAGIFVHGTSQITLTGEGIPFVSRGGLKLEAALNYFQIEAEGKVVMDVGSSTGGFTDCLLKRGAKKVFCIDVGYGQLAWSLRNDPRVVVMERTNIRYLDQEFSGAGESGTGVQKRFTEKDFEELQNRSIDAVVIDVSFISLSKVVPPVMTFHKDRGEMLALIKPQFEVGKGEVGKGGIIKDKEKRLSAVNQVRETLESSGLETIGIFESPVRGQKGNIEYFIFMKKGAYGG
ncbi:MAG: TlyA family RNA methyltransferase [Thermodesulfovibrionales bacterium]|nr:TlyA family RNA methyltransferase [Thermodesulfovibrionales bacterium]